MRQINFVNPNWQSLGSQTFTPIGGNTNWQPLGELAIPVQTEKNIVAIVVNVSNKKPDWKFSGWFIAKSQSGLLTGSQADLGLRYPTFLNQANLIFLPQITTTWSLYLQPPKWFYTTTIEAWEYIGVDRSEIEIESSILKFHINELKTLIGYLQNDITDINNKLP